MVEWLFFESWMTLLIVGVLVNFWLLVYWRHGGSARPLLVSLCLTLLWWVAQTSVVTPMERAQSIMRVVEDDIVASRTDGIMAALAPDFAAGEMDRQGFVDLIKRMQRSIDVRSVTRVRLEELNGRDDSFEFGLTYYASVAKGSDTRMTQSLWHIAISKVESGWKITRIEPEEINKQRIRGWDRLPSY